MGQNKSARRFEAKLRIHKGQQVFEFDTKNGKINVAGIDGISGVRVNGKSCFKKTIIIKRECLYAVSINAKNAEKKFIKMLEGNN